jgi:hypothetical protein
VPDWRDDVAAAVDSWIAAEGGPPLEGLRESIRSLTDAGGLAERLARGRPDPLPAGPSEEAPAGFTPAETQAFHACLTPGVRLVLTPPGSDRAKVLAEVIDHLLERGRRVLLVSAGDVAVDQALHEVMRMRPRPAGTLMRLGPPAELVGAYESAEQALLDVERRWTEIEPARSHLERAAALRSEVEVLQVAADQARRKEAEMVDRHHSMREHLAKEESATGLTWLRNRTEAWRLREQMAQLGVRVDGLKQEADAAQERADDRRRLLASRIAEHERQAAPLDNAQMEAARTELEEARQRAGEAARAVQAATGEPDAGDVAGARLVATTLARFRLHPAASSGRYDTVLVDEAGRAPLAEVLVPVAAARHTAVLLGDLRQLRPLANETEHSQDPQVARWLHSTCFDHCGIRTPEEAHAHEACAVLGAP